MRVATNSYSDAMLNQFSVLENRLNDLQTQSATGLSVQSPSDNPTAMQDTLNYLSDKAEQTQYSRNISTLQTRATSVGNVLSSLQTLTSRAQEIVTSATSGTASQSDLDSYASEVQQLTQEAVQLMNTKDASTGQYLFGGTNSTVPPYATTTDANGNLTGVTYQGNTSVNQTEIASGVTVTVDVPGANTGTSGVRGLITDATSGADLFNHLISFANDLTAGDTSAISGTDSANLQNDEDNMLYQVSSNGAVQTHLESAATLASSQSTSLDNMISNSSGANLADTMVQLSQAQTAYQAALESSAQIMQLSILNYLPT
jgi:flagellar hook-associated protein 3 FlgL